MALYTEDDRTAIDAVIKKWRDTCLIGDGSLLFDGESVWSATVVQELIGCFVDDHLEGEPTFEDKLRVQMVPASNAAKRLMAETIAVYFLFSSSVTGTRKREVLNMALDLAGEDPIGSDALVGRAFDDGIGGPGQAFNSNRQALLSYLLRFTRRFKQLDEPGRRAALIDAWAFKQWLVGEAGEADGGRQMMRELLLHLLFPEDFERIASGVHKAAIREALEGLVADPPEDIDQSLRAIRHRIGELVEDPEQSFGALDFYKPGLRETWDPSEGGSEDEETGISHLAALEIKRQAVLYGPPGTGNIRPTRPRISRADCCAIRLCFAGDPSPTSRTSAASRRSPTRRCASSSSTRPTPTRTSSVGCASPTPARPSPRTDTCCG